MRILMLGWKKVSDTFFHLMVEGGVRHLLPLL
jgi:hypothetical protein